MFLLNYTLCHLLESPHQADSQMGCHNIQFSWIVKKMAQVFIRFSFLPEPRLSYVYNIGGLIFLAIFAFIASMVKIKVTAK